MVPFLQEIGESIGKELWGSVISKYFYGCSNASSKFPSTFISEFFSGNLSVDDRYPHW